MRCLPAVGGTEVQADDDFVLGIHCVVGMGMVRLREIREKADLYRLPRTYDLVVTKGAKVEEFRPEVWRVMMTAVNETRASR